MFNMNTLTYAICYIALAITFSDGARILGIVPSPSYSHQIFFQPLWRELSLRGHQLTVLTTDPVNDPSLTNLTEIDLHSSYEIWHKNLLNIIKMNKENIFKMGSILLSTVDAICEQQLEYPDVKRLIKNESEHFDLLMVECSIPAMLAFSERFKCPYIVISSMDSPIFGYDALGNPGHPVLYPDVSLPFGGELTFIERLISTVFNIVMRCLGDNYIFPRQQAFIEKHFGKGYPSLMDILKNVSMLFINTDPFFHPVRPLVPAIIQIGGGTHQRSSKPLPKDLQKHLDNAPQGFIYFSLGSNVKSSDLSETTRDIILEVFAELPYIVLWKFELEDLPGKPDNVIISKWFPQQDIFKHPNIKLFITQGGLQSIEEAIYDCIPMVGIPFFVDQPGNIRKMVSNGLGLSLDYKTIDKESFKETVLEVINNPKYRNRIKQLSYLAKDQPMTGLERAVWWTEYVIRHKGAKDLRSPALDLPVYQYYLLDVIGFCLLVILVAIYCIFKIVKLIFKLIRYFTTKPKVKTQ